MSISAELRKALSRGNRVRGREDFGAIFDLVYANTISVGEAWFVNSTTGNNGNPGTLAKPFATITYAVSKAAAGDTIYLKGTFTESVTVSLAGLRIIGVGTGPKQAKWSPVTGNDKVNLTIAAEYVWVENIYFIAGPKSSTYSACIVLSGANHARIIGCELRADFIEAYYGIYSPVCDSDNVHIIDCLFHYFHTLTYGAAILGVEAGGLSYSTWHIEGCTFFSCVTAIDINGRGCVIKNNTIMEYGIVEATAGVGAVLAMGIDLSGTNSGANTVTGNQLGGTYGPTLYVDGASGDNWNGNYVGIVSTYAPYGLTVAVPT